MFKNAIQKFKTMVFVFFFPLSPSVWTRRTPFNTLSGAADIQFLLIVFVDGNGKRISC